MNNNGNMPELPLGLQAATRTEVARITITAYAGNEPIQVHSTANLVDSIKMMGVAVMTFGNSVSQVLAEMAKRNVADEPPPKKEYLGPRKG